MLPLLALLSACNTSTETANTEDLTPTNLNADELQRFSIAHPTTMEFDTYEHAFGKVFQNTDNKCVFVVKNTGKTPLIIEDAHASCGCTVPQKPDEPIMPGKTGKIEVIFHPNLSQEGKMIKTITVEGNTEPKIIQLKISAEVMARMM